MRCPIVQIEAEVAKAVEISKAKDDKRGSQVSARTPLAVFFFSLPIVKCRPQHPPSVRPRLSVTERLKSGATLTRIHRIGGAPLQRKCVCVCLLNVLFVARTNKLKLARARSPNSSASHDWMHKYASPPSRALCRPYSGLFVVSAHSCELG